MGGNKRCLLRDPYRTHIMWSERRIFLIFNLVERTVCFKTERKVKADKAQGRNNPKVRHPRCAYN